MDNIKIGDNVRVQDRKNWPTPPGYRLADSEGTVVKWVEFDEVMEDFQNYAHVRIEKSRAEEYVGLTMVFRTENLVKL